MRRGLVHTAVWALATSAAAAMSWCGVRTVLTSTDSAPPSSLPLSAEAPSPAGSEVSATYRPKPSRSTPPASVPSVSPPGGTGPPTGAASRSPSEAGRGADDPQRTGSSPHPTRPSHTPQAPAPDPGDTVRGYTVRGGQVVFDLRSDSAELVSATPDTGWQMQVWKQSGWIRVDFTAGSDATSIFCTWNDGPPTVQVDQH